jgi:hypothetical protein
LLFGRNRVFPQVSEEQDRLSKSLLGDNHVIAALDSTVRYGLDIREEEGNRWAHYSMKLDTGGSVSVRSLGAWNGARPTQVFGELLPEVSFETLQEILEEDVLPEARKLYAREIMCPIYSAGVASKLGAAVLFDREVDGLILSRAGSPDVDSWKQTSVVTPMRLALPYLECVPLDRLIEIRQAVPDAFLGFRARMFEIVRKAEKEEEKHAWMLARELTRTELLPSISELESELAASLIKARMLGHGLPIISLLGSFLMHVGGAPDYAVVPPLLVGAGGNLKAQAELASGRRKAPRSPFYFVWLARQSRVQS